MKPIISTFFILILLFSHIALADKIAIDSGISDEAIIIYASGEIKFFPNTLSTEEKPFYSYQNLAKENISTNVTETPISTLPYESIITNYRLIVIYTLASISLLCLILLFAAYIRKKKKSEHLNNS